MTAKKDLMPEIFFKFGNHILHFAGIPVFFILFVILYRPFSLVETLELRSGGFIFNVMIISAILFVTLLFTRLLMWGQRSAAIFSRRVYLVWCAGEVLLSSLFISLYLCLMSGGLYSYIDLLPVALGELASIVVFPYIMFTLLLESDILARYSSEKEPQEKRIKFYDERHNLKLVTDPSALLYICSRENYCEIYYMESGRIRSFMLRATMKGIEPLCSKHGIKRCHRSYFVNTMRINVLRKDRDGFIFAELDQSGVENIPVSQRYYEDISASL